jgi:small subunit ribosomal protein S20
LAEAAKKVKKQGSAEKRMKQALKRRVRNTTAKSRLKTTFKKAGEAIASGKLDEAQTLAREAISAMDSNAMKGIVHKNKAARKKSRLVKKLNKAVKEKAQ